MIAKTKYSSSFHWNSWWGNFFYWKVFRGFLGTCCPIIKKRGNQLKYFHAPQSSHIPQLCFLGIFNYNQKMKSLFLEINGCNPLQHSGDRWKLLSIITKNYLSYMWHKHMSMTLVTSLVKPGIITYLLL